MEEEELLEQPENSATRLKPWQFKKGQSGNPNGRPPGKSLKERAKAMLNAMSEEEEQEFLAGIDKRTIWEMAEGKPQQDTKIDGNLDIKVSKLEEIQSVLKNIANGENKDNSEQSI